MDLHIPKVRIITPQPDDKRPFTEAIFTKIEVDGETWPIIDYRIEGRGVNGTQGVTLTFHADVTIEHSA